jgi:hypothetical protein
MRSCELHFELLWYTERLDYFMKGLNKKKTAYLFPLLLVPHDLFMCSLFTGPFQWLRLKALNDSGDK